MNVNERFENVSSQGRVRKFFREGAPTFGKFSSVVFSRRINLKQIEEQKVLWESPGNAPPQKKLKICIL